MNFFESFRIALVALAVNKLRAALTMLGIIIGVGAVVGMLALGEGFQQFLNEQFDELGIGTVYVLPFVDTRLISNETAPQLLVSDATAIMQPGRAPAVLAVAAEFSGGAQVFANGRRRDYGVRAVTTGFWQVSPQDLAVGRILDASDGAGGARVAVIGREVALDLFDSPDAALGQRITLNGVAFSIVGVLASEAGQVSIGADPAEAIFVPYETGVNRLYRNRITDRVNVSSLTIKAASPDLVDDAISQATLVLRDEHRLTYQDNNFTIINPEQISNQFNTLIAGFSAFLGVVAGISLLVGGIGIMNIMLVSVTERTREIGLRKAVGAKRSDILWQFLLEALMLSLIGCAIGIGLGYLFSLFGTFLLVNVFAAEGAAATVTLSSILLSTTIAALIGIGFGFFPALQASRLNPIDALRTE